LKSFFDEAVFQAYELAVLYAAAETGLSESAFPESCPYTIEQIMGEYGLSEK